MEEEKREIVCIKLRPIIDLKLALQAVGSDRRQSIEGLRGRVRETWSHSRGVAAHCGGRQRTTSKLNTFTHG